MNPNRLPIFAMEPMNCEILAQRIAAATPSSRIMLVEFSDALVIDANDRVQKAFAELEPRDATAP